MLNYFPLKSFEKGIVFDLLSLSFRPLMDAELESKLRRYDEEVFENPETEDSFVYHSPEAVKVFFHVPRLRLNWISIGKEDDFSLSEDSTNFDKG